MVLALGAFVCQTVLYPAFLIPELRIDLFLVLLIHFSFSYQRSKTLVLALFLGLLMDLGLPLRGCFYPLIYVSIALLAFILRQNLNLQSRWYQALFLGLCTLIEGLGVRTILGLQDAGFAESGYFLRLMAGRIIITALIGPLLLAGLKRVDQYLSAFIIHKESQEA
jgi:rod shape-determining protein MreD